jgi:hypothetical protein
MIIQSGTGESFAAEVTKTNRLNTSARVGSRLYYASQDEGLAFTWTAVSADVAANLGGMYLVNTSQVRDLHITKMYLYADVTTQFKIWVPATYTAPNGTSVVGVNLNRTSAHVAEATCTVGETNNAFAAAQVICTVRNNELTSDVFGQWVDFENALILGYHNAVEVELVADTAAFEITIFGYFDNA